MSLAALALSVALAAKLSPAPTAPAGRRASDWAAYNKARAEAGLLPRKAARGATRVSASLVQESPSPATAPDGAPPVRILPLAPRDSAESALAVQAVPDPTPAPRVEDRSTRTEPDGERTARHRSAAERVVSRALRRASAAVAAERAARTDELAAFAVPPEPARAVGVPVADAAEAEAEPVVAEPVVAEPVAAVPLRPGVAAVAVETPVVAPARAPAASARADPPRVAVAERPRSTGAQVDTESGALRAGLEGASVEVRFVARVGSLTFAVERPALALR